MYYILHDIVRLLHDIVFLKIILILCYDLNSTINTPKPAQYGLFITQTSRAKLIKVVLLHMAPSMLYKLNLYQI